MAESTTPQGWWWPRNSRKMHYMVGTRSLCGRWSTLAAPRPGMYSPDDGIKSRNDCAECRRRLAKKKAPA